MQPDAAISTVEFTAIDFESAGATRGHTDVPVQVGLAGGQLDHGPLDLYVSYLRSDRPITWSARRVHSITDDQLAEAPRLQELWPELRSRLAGRVVVAHGAGTEKRFLRHFPGHGFGPWVDTLTLARAVWPSAPSHSLQALCDQARLTETIGQLVPHRRWHDALFDAAASLLLLRHLIEALAWQRRPLALLLAR